MDKLDKAGRLVYISSWKEQQEEKKRKIKEEARLRAEQLRELNKQVWMITEVMRDRANNTKCDN